MILVVGGMASGKRTFARGLGYPESQMAFDVHERLWEAADDPQGTLATASADSTTAVTQGVPAVDPVGLQADQLVDELAALAVVTCCEVGSGIVPMDAAERLYRQRVGRLTAQLAQRADTVVRMVCGIPMVLKGDSAAFEEGPVAQEGSLAVQEGGPCPGVPVASKGNQIR